MNRRNRRKSNAFTSLTQTQITNLREAYDILDANDDKKISRTDLLNFSEKFNPLSEEEINIMLNELPEPSYISLLTFFAEKLGNIDEIPQIKCDLSNLSEGGVLYESSLSEKLGISVEDARLLFTDTSKGGVVSIDKLTCLLKHGEILENLLTVSEEVAGPSVL